MDTFTKWVNAMNARDKAYEAALEVQNLRNATSAMKLGMLDTLARLEARAMIYRCELMAEFAAEEAEQVAYMGADAVAAAEAIIAGVN